MAGTMARKTADGDVAHKILAVAEHLKDGEPPRPAFDVARERGWIDPEGEPTKDGRDLVAALGEQAGTRTVFRNV